IADDLLDVLGEEAATGKSLGTDLAKQKPTLPLIRLLAQASADQRATLTAQLKKSDNHHQQLLAPWYERGDALTYARDKAIWYAGQARRELQELPSGPALEVLRELTDFVVTRGQ